MRACYANQPIVLLDENDARIGELRYDEFCQFRQHLLVFERRGENFPALENRPQSLISAPSLRKIRHETQRFLVVRFGLRCDTTNQDWNSAAIVAEEFLFIRREHSRGMEFAASFGIQIIEVRRRHLSPVELTGDYIGTRITEHVEKNVIGFGNEPVLYDDYANDSRLNDAPKAFFARAKRVFDSVSRGRVSRN